MRERPPHPPPHKKKHGDENTICTTVPYPGRMKLMKNLIFRLLTECLMGRERRRWGERERRDGSHLLAGAPPSPPPQQPACSSPRAPSSVPRSFKKSNHAFFMSAAHHTPTGAAIPILRAIRDRCRRRSPHTLFLCLATHSQHISSHLFSTQVGFGRLDSAEKKVRAGVGCTRVGRLSIRSLPSAPDTPAPVLLRGGGGMTGVAIVCAHETQSVRPRGESDVYFFCCRNPSHTFCHRPASCGSRRIGRGR